MSAQPTMPKPTTNQVSNVEELEKGQSDHIETASVDDKNREVVRDPNAGYDGFAHKTDPAEIKLVRKLDIRIMTSLWAMYWLNYLDRNAIALAKISTFTKDLNLNDTQFQTAVSILFVGYVIMGIPANMLITRIRPSLFLSLLMMTWSVVSICTAFAGGFGGLMATRFILGAVEAPFYPGALLIISNFYTRTEIATRIAIMYTGNILANALAGLIAAGIFQLHGKLGYSGWQWMFIIQGAATGVVALACYPFLPDTPLTTRWLTPEERTLAHTRLQRNMVDTAEPGSTWSGLKQSVSDYRVWVFALMYHCHMAANGFKNFFPSVVATLGFSQTIGLVLTCPPYLIAGIATIAVSLTSGKWNERTWHITACKAVAILGFVLAPATLITGVRYFAMCVFTTGTYAVNSLILGWAATVCSQTVEKKAVTIALLTSIGNTAFIYTPYLFREVDKPRYALGMGGMAVFTLGCALSAWWMRIILMRQNKKLKFSNSPTTYPY